MSSVSLKPEQEVAVKALLDGRDVLAVLPTGFGKSMIFQTFVRAKYSIDGRATIVLARLCLKEDRLGVRVVGACSSHMHRAKCRSEMPTPSICSRL